jgi:hypothetical protein
MVSSDGISWTSVLVNPGAYQSVAWSPGLGLFVAVANDGTGAPVLVSFDGTVWLPSETTVQTNQWNGIAWSPELGIFAAVASSGTGDRVMVSQSPPASLLPGIVPVGAVVAWHKSFENTPALPAEFVECNGQTLSDPLSPYDGQDIPDLNGAMNDPDAGVPIQRFLRGSTTSTAKGGADSHNHYLGMTLQVDAPEGEGGGYNFVYCSNVTDSSSFLPSYHEVVWIMRVK